MSRKKTVQLNYSATKTAIDKNFRSNVVFCEAMGFKNRNSWVSDLKRNKNLPSPEEAARMCLLLNTTPEEILTEPADIELVNGLIEAERAKQGIKKDLPNGEVGLTDAQKEAWELIQKFDDNKLRKFVDAMRAVLGD